MSQQLKPQNSMRSFSIEGLNQELLILGEKNNMDAMELYLQLRKKAKVISRNFEMWEIIALAKDGVLKI